jgi:hypothetical protein
MLPKRTMAALAAGALLTWGSAHAAPEASETQEIPVIILELQPGPADGSGNAATEREQALVTMLLMQLLMGLQAEGESPGAPVAAPIADNQRRL